MTSYYNTIITAVSLLLGFTACTSDEQLDTSSPATGKPVEVIASIGNAAETKATPGNGDNISYTTFSPGDKIGFFATGGLAAENVELTYTTTSFLSEKDELQWTDGDATSVVAYYPYASMKDKVNIWRDESSSGSTWEEGFEDVLISNENSVVNGTLVNLSFHHHFAMLIIKRGNGFEEQNGWSDDQKAVKVSLNKKVGHTAIFDETTPSLTLKVDDTDGTQELIANPGTYTPKGISATVDCYYVLIPVGKFDDKSDCQVASITLTNKLGISITIPYTKTLTNNYKYLITAEMRDDAAIIEPEEIIRWTDEEVPIVKPVGIEESSFVTWLSNYNLLKRGTMEEQTAAKKVLVNYGTTSDNGNTWTFLLLEDIDASKVWPNNDGKNASVVSTFTDVLDGQGHTISGIKLKESGDNAGFCGTLSGTVKNLILKDISVNGLANTGGIAGSMTDGTVHNCKIEGFSPIFGTEKVGGLVGSNSGGTITKCTSSATVSGTTDVDLLVGSGSPSLTDCFSTGTLIIRKKD